MRILTFDVPKRCDWLTSNNRRVRLAEARLVAQWKAAGLNALPEGSKPFTGRVRITAKVYKYNPTGAGRRYDPMNWYPTAKAIVDGIVAGGVLEDDDWKHVLGPIMDHGGFVGIDRQCIVIMIEELT